MSQAPCRDFTAVRNDAFVLSRLLRRYTASRSLAEGKRLHDHIAALGIDRDTVVGNLLVDMYGKCGCIEDAVGAFQRIHRRNVFSWSILIAAYARNGHYYGALHLYRRMQQDGVMPNHFTLSIVLQACSSMSNVGEGRKIHATMDACQLQFEYVSNALVVLYGRGGDVQSAEAVFSAMQRRDPASWTAMVAAYTNNGHCQEALNLVQKMLMEQVLLDAHAFVVIIDACAAAGDVSQGQEIHELARRMNFDGVLPVANALINMYGKCGCVNDARTVFDGMSSKDIVSWTSMIVVYVQNGEPWPALALFQTLELEPDRVTYAAVLDACASAGDALQGKAIHARIAATFGQSLASGCNNTLSTALVKMYGVLGCVDKAEAVYGSMKSPDVVSLSAMIGVHAQTSDTGRALEIFGEMLQQGLRPNAVTFINTLSACAHAGLVYEACIYYHSMAHDFGIQPGAKHVVCMVDVFGKLGWLAQAEALCREVGPCESRIVACSILLATCQLQMDEEMGMRVAKLVLEVESDSAVHYVAFTNMLTRSARSALSEAVVAWEQSD